MQQADAMVLVAELAVTDDADVATPGVAAALAVLAGIAAADAACCVSIGKRARGQDHAHAAQLVSSVVPGGAEMAKALRDLLSATDESHYGLHLVSAAKAGRMLKSARTLVELARRVVDS